MDNRKKKKERKKIGWEKSEETLRDLLRTIAKNLAFMSLESPRREERVWS